MQPEQPQNIIAPAEEILAVAVPDDFDYHEEPLLTQLNVEGKAKTASGSLSLVNAVHLALDDIKCRVMGIRAPTWQDYDDNCILKPLETMLRCDLHNDLIFIGDAAFAARVGFYLKDTYHWWFQTLHYRRSKLLDTVDRSYNVMVGGETQQIRDAAGVLHQLTRSRYYELTYEL